MCIFQVVAVTHLLSYGAAANLLRWIPLFPVDHLNLICLLWFQIPYFRGAETVCNFGVSTIAKIFHSSNDLDRPSTTTNTQPSSAKSPGGSGNVGKLTSVFSQRQQRGPDDSVQPDYANSPNQPARPLRRRVFAGDACSPSAIRDSSLNADRGINSVQECN